MEMGEREGPNPIVWIIGIIFIFAFLFVLGYFLYNLISSGQAEVYLKEAWVDAEPGAESVKGGLFGFFEYISNPATARRDFDSVVEKNVDNPNLGVKITEFKGVNPSFEENKPVQLFARIEMASLSGKDKEENVILGCSLEDYNGDSAIEPSTISYYGDGSLYVDSAICKFSRGISVDGQEVDSKKAVINATSEYKQLVTYRAYFMRLSDYSKLRLAGKDPFKYYGINYPLLMPGNEVKSLVTDGPLNVGIGVAKSQPFTEGSEYVPLIVSFSNRYFTGNLVEINDFKLILPNLIELENNPNTCDFSLVNSGEDYNEYKLTDYAREVKLKNPDRAGDVSLSCSFRVSNEFPSEFSEIFYTVFRLEAEYTYVTREKFYVEIRDVKDEGVDACNYINDPDECFEASGCRSQTINGEFSNCIKCVYSSCEEEYGTDSENCELDPCRLKDGCTFAEGRCRSITTD